MLVKINEDKQQASHEHFGAINSVNVCIIAQLHELNEENAIG